MDIQQFFAENPSVALAFSGGVDSSYLLYAGLRCSADIGAYYVKSVFTPAFELDDARRLAKQTGAAFTIIEADILSDPKIACNPPDRCYHCKKTILATIMARAEKDGYKTVIDGTNATDDADDRPGTRALTEMSVKSPLKECGVTKDDIRRMSKEAGLFTWDKPAYACLATRVPTGCALTAELLKRVEYTEDALRLMGFTDFRARVKDAAVNLQFTHGQLESAFAKRVEIIAAVKPYFDSVLLDLEGRIGGL